MEETREERSERIKKGELREGWTTGTCASASAKAATLILLGEEIREKVEIDLPIKERKAEIKINRYGKSKYEAFSTVIKDAGDDPDVTHGAEIGAIVRFGKEKGIKIIGGEGVGVITKPGLGLEIGEPDITPVPRKMIKNAVISAIRNLKLNENDVDLEVEIFVPEGKERAKKTLLERLGVIGGIGILGTLGIVVPYSTGAWKASIARQISVAKESGVDTIVGTTGRQSEELAKKFFHNIPDVAFVDIGDFIGFTIRYAESKGIKRFIYAGFPAKISKFAKGEEFTHAKKSSIDINFLVDLVKQIYNINEDIQNELLSSNTVREFTEKAKAFGLTKVFEKLTELAQKRCNELCYNKIHSEVIMFDFEGEILHYRK